MAKPSKVTAELLAELDRKATDAATAAKSDRWFVVGDPWGDGTLVNAGNQDPHGGQLVCDVDMVTDWVEGDEPDPVSIAEHIAAADPATVSMLVAEIRRLRYDAEAQRSVRRGGEVVDLRGVTVGSGPTRGKP